MASRALPDLIARIKVDSTGVDAALNDLTKGFTKVNLGLLTTGVALGGLIMVGKSAVENYKSQEEAVLLLNQAYATQGTTYAANKAQLDAFLTTNKAFITDQYDTEKAMAQVVRSGKTEAESIRILNDALDIAAVKHIAVSEAATLLIKYMAGNAKAVKDVGITTAQLTEITKSNMSVEEKHAALLALIESKYKDGKLATDAYAQSQNTLNMDWQNFTGAQGGPIVGTLTGINTALDTGVQIADLYGQGIEKSLGMTWNRVKWVFGQSTDTVKANTAAVQFGTTPWTDYAAAEADAAAAAKDIAAQLATELKVLKDINNAVAAAADAQVALDQADQTVIDDTSLLTAAHKHYLEVLKAHPKASQAARDAAHAEKVAYDQVWAAIVKDVIAVGDLAAAHDDAIGSTHGATDATDAQITKLEALRKKVAPGSQLWKDYTAWINHLKDTPSNIDTSVTVDYRTFKGKKPGAFASGGRPEVGVPYWVGEHGPELRVDDRPGAIIPHSQSVSMGSGMSTQAIEDLLRKILAQMNVQPSTTGIAADVWKVNQAAGLNRLRGFSGA